MRVIATVWTLLAVGAHAQDAVCAAASPSAPGSYIETVLSGYGSHADGIDGGAITMRSRGAYALHRGLEIGAGWSWRAHWLSGGDGLGSLARLGLLPWAVWAGTGFTWDGGGFGVRLEAGVGPRAVGGGLDVGGEAWSVTLRLSAAHRWPSIEARLDADLGAVVRFAPSGAAGGSLGVVIGDSAAPVRPYVAVEVRGSNDLGVSGRARLGAWIAVARGVGLRADAFANLPDDREGFRLGVEVAVFVWSMRASPLR